MTVLACTAVRSLRYQELAIAYALHSRMEYITPSSIPSREDIYNLSLRALQVELDDSRLYRRSVRVADFIRRTYVSEYMDRGYVVIRVSD